jgi:transcriptional regulator with XRE-family HTH domain
MTNPDYVTNYELMQLLARRLKSYRLAARMSQKEMSEKSGVGLATISHFEQGVKPNMTLGNFISLLRTVGMERRVADLLPELPMSPLALKQINKLVPKHVRRKQK